MTLPPRGTATSETHHSDVRRAAAGGTLNLVGAGVAAITGLAVVIVVTRGLPRSQAGLFFTATSVFLVLTVLTKMGTSTGLVYFISKMRAAGSEDRIGFYIATAMRTVAVAAALAGGLLAGASALASLWVHGSGLTFTRLALILAPFVVGGALSDTVLSATRGFGTMRPTVLVENIGRTVLQLVLCTLAAATTDSAEWLVLAWAAPYVISLALGMSLLRSLHAPGTSAGVPTADRPALRREYWRFTAPLAFVGVAQLLLQRLDIVLVAILKGPAAAAVYTAATRFLVAGQLGNTAIGTAVQPELGSTLSVGLGHRALRLYQAATSWLVLLTWPFYLLCAVFPVWILKVFGHSYTGATDVIVVLALTMLVATACGSVDIVLSMSGRTMFNLLNIGVALTINITLDLILIPRYGVTGAAIGWAAAIFANNLLPLSQVVSKAGLHPFGRPTLLAIVVAGSTTGVVPVCIALGYGEGTGPFITAVMIGLAAFAGLVYVLRRPLGLAALVRRGREPTPSPAADPVPTR